MLHHLSEIDVSSFCLGAATGLSVVYLLTAYKARRGSFFSTEPMPIFIGLLLLVAAWEHL